MKADYLAVTDLEAITLERRESHRTSRRLREDRARAELRWEMRWQARDHPSLASALAHVATRAGRGAVN